MDHNSQKILFTEAAEIKQGDGLGPKFEAGKAYWLTADQAERWKAEGIAEDAPKDMAAENEPALVLRHSDVRIIRAAGHNDRYDVFGPDDAKLNDAPLTPRNAELLRKRILEEGRPPNPQSVSEPELSGPIEFDRSVFERDALLDEGAAFWPSRQLASEAGRMILNPQTKWRPNNRPGPSLNQKDRMSGHLGNDDRGREYWAPQPLWKGERCFLLGGGPSLDQATVDRIRHAGRVMAINSSVHLAPWADALFFTDHSWFETHRKIVEDFRGLVFTLARHSKAAIPDKLKRLEIEPWAADFPLPGSSTIRQGRSSGHTAVSLAAALGAKTVVLLGYDVCFDNGRSHHHDDYSEPDPLIYDRDFLPAWAGWNAAALRIGVQVLNATPRSALREFPMVSLDDVLMEKAA